MVFYREQGVSQWSNRDVKLVYSLDLTGLTTGKTYSVRVAGYTKIGQGIKSTPRGIIVGGKIIIFLFSCYFYPEERDSSSSLYALVLSLAPETRLLFDQQNSTLM